MEQPLLAECRPHAPREMRRRGAFWWIIRLRAVVKEGHPCTATDIRALTQNGPSGAVGRARVLELDPDLGSCLAVEELREARESLIAPMLVLGRGPLWAGLPSHGDGEQSI